MIAIYPVVFTPIPEGIMAHVPDCNISTSGHDLANAIFMVRDAISLWCVCEQDDFNRTLPTPSALTDIRHKPDEIVTLVDCDIDAYRRSLENRAVKKTLTIPSWLNEQAEKANINFSQTLQKALKEELKITG